MWFQLPDGAQYRKVMWPSGYGTYLGLWRVWVQLPDGAQYRKVMWPSGYDNLPWALEGVGSTT